MKKAILMLQDGKFFEGVSVAGDGESIGQIVYNTADVGYQEIITDPTSRGLVICFAFPEIGNYGFNPNDSESNKIHCSGIIAKQISKVTSNWRATESFIGFLKKQKILAMERVDTRAILRHILKKGEMKCILSTVDFNPKSLLKKLKNSADLGDSDVASTVSTRKIYKWKNKEKLIPLNVFEKEKKYIKISDNKINFKVVVIDCGIKESFLRILASCNCNVVVVPIKTKAENILKLNPHGILISNGPGNPNKLNFLVEEIKKILGKKPILGIGLGHQILSLALNGKIDKMKSGHRGINHSIRNLDTKTVEVVSQNHGYVVTPNSFEKSEYKVKITHINLNDSTIEGIEVPEIKSFSVQYHPLPRPGAHDAIFVFNKFIKNMKTFKEVK